jgi:transposase
MPASISNDLKARIPALRYEQGFNVKKICQILNIKKTLVYQSLRLHRTLGLAYDPNARRGVRRRVLTNTDLSFIRMLLNQQHTIYLDEIQEQLYSRRAVKVSIPTLTRTLRRLHFTHKDVSGKALERDDRRRAIYMNRIADLVPDPEMLMFGDEAHKDERTSNRRTGWSRQGTQCVQRKCFVRGKRFSILPIITLDGIIVHDIIEGSVTSERFVEFLRELVVCCYVYNPKTLSNRTLATTH